MSTEELEPSWLFGVLVLHRPALSCREQGTWSLGQIPYKRSLSRQGHTGVTTPPRRDLVIFLGEETQAEPQRKK